MFFVSSCSPNLEFSVKDRWSKSITNLALQPVYPMREDVFIGTLRLVRVKDEAFSIGSRSLGYLDLAGALDEAQRKLPNYPASGEPSKLEISAANGVQKTAKTAWKQPTNTSGVFPPTPGVAPQRLRLAAIPGVSLTRVTEADFGRRNLFSAIAGAYRRDARLDINVTAVETVEINDIDAFREFKNNILVSLISDQNYRDGICASAAALGDPALDNVNIQMITRVFYARGIEYTFSDDASGALRAAEGDTGIPDSSNIFQQSTVDAGSAVGGEQQGENPSKQAQAPNITTISPGTVAKIAVQRKNGSSLTEIFERPLAFGVQTLSVSPKRIGLRCNEFGEGLYEGTAILKDNHAEFGKGKKTKVNKRKADGGTFVINDDKGTPLSIPAECKGLPAKILAEKKRNELC